MRPTWLTIWLTLATVAAGVALALPAEAVPATTPSQPEPTTTPECDPALVEPTVDLEFAPATARSGQTVTARASFRNLHAYAVELFLSLPGQRTIAHDWSGGYSARVALTFVAPAGQGRWSAHVRARGEGVVCENGRPVPSYRAFQSTSPFTLTVSGSRIWLPLVVHWQPAGPATSTPAATSTGAPVTGTSQPTTPTSVPTITPSSTPVPGRYLLVEKWTNARYGPGCPPMTIDFPTYWFDESTGVLRVWASMNPRLEPSDVGYYASGTDATGRVIGTASGLLRIEGLPASYEDRVSIESVDTAGEAVLTYAGEELRLPPGGRRQWRDVGVWRDPGCVVTSTVRITNFGYQDRSKVEYY